MGTCDSSLKLKIKQRNLLKKRKKTNKLINNKKKNNTNSISSSSTKNSSNPKKHPKLSTKKKPSDYILPSNLAIYDDLLNFYTISNEIIGSGASGMVSIGENSTGKFAIKRINKLKIKYPEEIIKEAEFAKKLNHKNIIKYYGVFEDLKFISFIMELGEGGDLFDFIVNSPIGHLPLDITIELTEQILSILIYLHYEMKIIHRDLKPENFLITIDEKNNIQIKLIDFGMSTFYVQGKKLYDYLGTPNYAAPEIVLEDGYNEKVDIWALGVILFNMLTGFEPFKGRNEIELENEIKCKEIEFDLIENEDMKNLCKKMLNRVDYNRINAKDAYECIKKIKKDREILYNQELKKIENNKKDDKNNISYKKDKLEFIAFIDAFNTKFNFY